MAKYCSMCGQESEKLFNTKRQLRFGDSNTMSLSFSVSRKHNLSHTCFACISEVIPTQIDEKHIVEIELC